MYFPILLFLSAITVRVSCANTIRSENVISLRPIDVTDLGEFRLVTDVFEMIKGRSVISLN